MSDLISFVYAMRRPKLLIRAAMHGLGDYDRDRMLKRLTHSPALPNPKGAVASLLSVEETLETARVTGDAAYNVRRHVEVMIALLSEVRLLAQPKLTSL